MAKAKSCGVNGVEAAKKSATAKTQINSEVKIAKIKPKENIKKNYYCTCCGRVETNPKGKFNKSKSPLYIANDGYVNICYDCRDSYYYSLVELFCGNEEKAIERMSQIFDWLFHEEPLAASKQISFDRSRVGDYSNKLNLGQATKYGTTYLDTIKIKLETTNNIIESKEHYEQLKSNGEVSSSAASIERWGAGFPDPDYKLLDDHYKMLKKYNPNCDNNQEIFIKDLCYTKLLQMKSMREGGKSDDFDKFTKLYRETFKQAGLKTIQETDNSGEETLGVTLATIAQYTPEEYYKDKELYKDFDGLGDYFERFVKRPLRNLITGSKDRDVEFSVKEDLITNEIDGDIDE